VSGSRFGSWFDLLSDLAAFILVVVVAATAERFLGLSGAIAIASSALWLALRANSRARYLARATGELIAMQIRERI
jgi:phosphatidylglycerophosphate synthase